MRLKQKELLRIAMVVAADSAIRAKIEMDRTLDLDDIVASIKRDKNLPQVRSEYSLGMIMDAICEHG